MPQDRAPRRAEPGPDEVRPLLAQARAFLYPRWQGWHAERRAVERGLARLAGTEPAAGQANASAGMAKFSASFLAQALADEFGGRWTVAGGLEDDGGGLRPPGGGWRDHFWVSHKGLILDVCADAHGLDALYVVEEGDPRYRRTVAPADLKVMLRDNARRIDGWLREWRAFRRGPFT